MRSRISVVGGKAVSCFVATTAAMLFNIQITGASDDIHEPINLEMGRYSIPSDEGPQEIIEVSAYCGECHSEEVGESASNTRAPSHEFGGSGTTHPVEVEYPPNQRGYRPKEDLDPGLVLIDGRMTCLTCHSPEPTRALVFPKEQSKLCVACHEK